ncbi:MAG: Asp23/Gls24 family envelope stress response protein [Lachnospiraceae bacterium]|nr:Asp23/Gls24 family envelope stress response protein [Lachnospiraceae bacterium]
MKGTLDTHLGNVAIDNNVIAEYAGGVALDCYGVAGMAGINVAEGVASILKKDSLGKGISVSLDNNKLSINLHIIVAYGVSIQAVASNVMSEVKYKVEQFAGLDVEKVNVFVEGVALVGKED